jgi:hypothetical protein
MNATSMIIWLRKVAGHGLTATADLNIRNMRSVIETADDIAGGGNHGDEPASASVLLCSPTITMAPTTAMHQALVRTSGGGSRGETRRITSNR